MNTLTSRMGQSLMMVLCMLAMMGAQVFGQNMAEKEIPFDPDTRVGKLDNGLHYFIKKNQKPENYAELRLAVNAGSLLETEEQQGLAHFAEHMAFNGTKNFPKADLVNYLESIGTKFGAHLNAYTSFDETVYMLRIPTDDKEKFNKGFQILEDWAHNVTMDGEEIDKERGVVIEEWRTRLGAQERMSKITYPKLYYNSRYAERLPIGKKKVLETFDHSVLKQFYMDWYRPDLMAVVAVGDFDVDEVEKMVQEKFGNIAKPIDPKTRTEYAIPDHKETLIAIASDEEASWNMLQVTYKHERHPMENMADYRSSIINDLCTSMLNSRLEEILQGEDPPFSYAYTGYGYMTKSKDNFESFAIAHKNRFNEALSILLAENERAMRFGFTESELERQKKSTLTYLEKANKEKDKMESRSLVMSYVYHYLEGDPVPGAENTLKMHQELFPTISVDEVNARMKTFITDENRVITIQASNKDGAIIPSEAEIRETLEKVEEMEITAYEDEVVDAPLMADLPQAGKIKEEMYFEGSDITKWVFENDLTVYLKPTDFKNDEIIFTSYSPGGSSNVPDADYYSAMMSDQIISSSGIGPYDYVQLGKYLSDKIAGVSPFIGTYSEGIRGSCSPKDLEIALQMTHLYFTQPRKDKTAFNSEINKMKGMYGNLLSNPDYYFFDQYIKLLSQNNMRSGYPTAEKLEKADFDKLHEIYAERIQDASDFTFTFVGNFDLAEMKTKLSQYLGSLPSTNREDTWKDLDIDPPAGVVEKEFRKGKEPKSQVRMYWHGDFEWNRKNRYELQSTLSILSIMLRESMREDQGGVYGVGAYQSTSKIPEEEYSITISFTCSPDNVNTLIETAMKDIQTLKDEGPSEENLAKVREIQKKELEVNQKQNRWWMSRINSYVQYDIDFKEMEKADDNTASITFEQVKQTANTYFNNGQFIKAVLMPETDMQQTKAGQE